jgi:hypothetical protein
MNAPGRLSGRDNKGVLDPSGRRPTQALCSVVPNNSRPAKADFRLGYCVSVAYPSSCDSLAGQSSRQLETSLPPDEPALSADEVRLPVQRDFGLDS